MGLSGTNVRSRRVGGPGVMQAHGVTQWLDKQCGPQEGVSLGLGSPPGMNGSTQIWFPDHQTPYKGCPAMKSKLLKKKNSGHRPCGVVNTQQENIQDSSVPWRGRENPPDRVNPAVAAQARKDFPGSPEARWPTNQGLNHFGR
jgi:hypothetical protein